MFFNWQDTLAANSKKLTISPDLSSDAGMRVCFYATAVLSIVFSSLSIINNGFDLTSILFDLLAMSGRYAALLGNEGTEYGMIGLLSVSLRIWRQPSAGCSTATTRFGGVRTLAISMIPRCITCSRNRRVAQFQGQS